MYKEDNNNESNEVSEDQELKDIHQEALTRFDSVQSALQDERQQCLDDRRFYSIAGAQWESEDFKTFFENKPKIEVNKIHLSVIRIINEYRNNKVTVNFTSKDGVQNEKLADTCDGLYRADENDSGADEAYDNAFEESVGGGFGAWRLRTDYEDPYDDEDERQRVLIEPIYDADTSVFFDLNSKKQDKSDSDYCFVLTSMTKEAYKEGYDDSMSSWDKTVSNVEFDWATADIVYLAEYYRVEIKERIIRIFQLPTSTEEERYTQEEFDNNEALEEELLAQGYKELRQKKVKQKKIHKYIMNGNKVIEDCGCIAGNNIPIIPTYGKRWFIDNIERVMGHVRLARDAQILKNIQLSKLAEISALSPVEKPILTPEQIAGHQNQWTDDNEKNYPYLLLNPITDMNGSTLPAAPLGYTKPPVIPPALGALLQITEQDINELLGNPAAGEKMVSNIAEDTVQLIQDRLDMQTYIYMSNFAKAMKRSGEVWLSMAKDIFIEDDRQMKVINKEGSSSVVRIGIPYAEKDGTISYENDLSKAKFGVNVDVGPATSSKKNATVKNLTKALAATTDPDTQSVISGLMMYNMEGEGLSDTKEYFRNKLIRMGAVKPNEEEAAQLAEEAQNAQPTAEENYLNSEAEKNAASIEKTKADIMKIMVEMQQTKAETVETLADVDIKNQEQIIKTLQTFYDTLEGNSAVSEPPLQNETGEIR